MGTVLRVASIVEPHTLVTIGDLPTLTFCCCVQRYNFVLYHKRLPLSLCSLFNSPNLTCECWSHIHRPPPFFERPTPASTKNQFPFLHTPKIQTLRSSIHQHTATPLLCTTTPNCTLSTNFPFSLLAFLLSEHNDYRATTRATQSPRLR